MTAFPPPAAAPRRGPGIGRWLLAAFLVVPVVELALAVQVGRWIGVIPTVALLLVESFVGAWIVRRQGAAALRALLDALREGRAPSRELADAALLLLGGALLLTPGFLTDIAGFALVLPGTRGPARRLVTGWLVRAAAARLGSVTIVRTDRGSGGTVIRGEVIDDPEGPRDGPPDGTAEPRRP